jgi:hypothetical protein
MRRYFSNRDLRKLTDEEFARLFVCRTCRKTPFWEYEDDHCHVDLECDEIPCHCALALKSWEDGWGKMPKHYW